MFKTIKLLINKSMDISFLKKIINNKLKLFLLVSFVILWLSLGIHPVALVNYSWNTANLINTLNFFIGISTVLIFIFIIQLIF